MKTATSQPRRLGPPWGCAPGRGGKRFRVTVIEWLSHNAVIEAESAGAAEALARCLWAHHGEHQVFNFSDSGIDEVQVEEVRS